MKDNTDPEKIGKELLKKRKRWPKKPLSVCHDRILAAKAAENGRK